MVKDGVAKAFVFCCLFLFSSLQVQGSSGEDKKNYSPENTENLIYGRIISAYRNRQLIELQKNLDVFQYSYPQSVYLDNAFYLAGLLQISKRDFAGAIQSFNFVLNQKQPGNKAVGAFLAKGFVYQNMGLTDQSRWNFSQVIHRYPGSPESFQAATQLELLTRLDKKGKKL